MAKSWRNYDIYRNLLRKIDLISFLNFSKNAYSCYQMLHASVP